MTDPMREDPKRLYAKQILLLNEQNSSTSKQDESTPIEDIMAQTMNAVDQYGNPIGSGYHSSEQSDSGRSPLSMSLGFLKNLTEKKSTRVDGQPLKRRGPKPDSKPALTRRQELNRQAQRTHRERKELYIKALEQEVLRLKEHFSTVARDKDNLFEENQRLKALLAQHGIPWTGSGGVDELSRMGSSTSYPTDSSHGSFSNPTSHATSPGEPNLQAFPGNGQQQSSLMPGQHYVNPNVDYDQAGIDFVLTLERPCMEHMQFLIERSDGGEDPCGHALMASCPPNINVGIEPVPEIPYGHGIQAMPEGAPANQKTWDLKKGDLALLLDLSSRLNLEGEITPVMAWGMVLANPEVRKLGVREIRGVCDELAPKIRCYGFGAVLEEFELSDALNNALASLSLSV